MLPEQTFGRARLARLRFQGGREQVNHRAIQGFGGDHGRLFDINFEEVEKQAVTAQLLPLFDTELRDESFV